MKELENNKRQNCSILISGLTLASIAVMLVFAVAAIEILNSNHFAEAAKNSCPVKGCKEKRPHEHIDFDKPGK